MKFKFKKYIYLLNDLSNLLLEKTRQEKIEKIKKQLFIQKIIIIVLLIVLIISFALNIFMFFNNNL